MTYAFSNSNDSLLAHTSKTLKREKIGNNQEVASKTTPTGNKLFLKVR